ncbi:hypothetical protein Tco_0093997 [Tanacetum coccineum]
MNVVDLTDNGNWIWSNDWRNHFHKLSNMNIIVLIEGKEGRVMWIGNNGKKNKFSIRSVWEIFKENRNDVSGHKLVWYPQYFWMNVKEKMKERNWDMNWRNVVNLLANERCNNTIKCVLHRMATATTAVYFIWNERNHRISLKIKEQMNTIVAKI